MFFSLQLSNAGGRIIIASDGVWDAVSAEVAFDCCRGMPADAAASQIVKVSLLMFYFCLQGFVMLFYFSECKLVDGLFLLQGCVMLFYFSESVHLLYYVGSFTSQRTSR